MSMYKAEYDSRLLYSQNYAADEGLSVSTDCYAVMWTYPQATSPTTTRVRLTYIYTKENGGISPVQGIMEQWKSEGWTVMDEFCDGYTDFNSPEELRDHMMEMAKSFLLGVPLGAEVEGDDAPKPPAPNKTGLKGRTTRANMKSRIEKMIKKPLEGDNPLVSDEDDIFAGAKIIKVKTLSTSGSKDEKPKSDDDDDDWI